MIPQIEENLKMSKESVPKDTMTVHDYFTDARIELMREMIQHNELCSFINQLASNTWEEQLGVVASYLGLKVDGAFLPEELEELYKGYTVQLKAVRTADSVMTKPELH